MKCRFVSLSLVLLLSPVSWAEMWMDSQGANFWNSQTNPVANFSQTGKFRVDSAFQQTHKDANREFYKYENPGGDVHEVGVLYKPNMDRTELEATISSRKLNGKTYTSVTVFGNNNRMAHQAYCHGSECYEVTTTACGKLLEKLKAPSFDKAIEDQKQCQDVAKALEESLNDKAIQREVEVFLNEAMLKADQARRGRSLGAVGNFVSFAKTAKLQTEPPGAFNTMMYLSACQKMDEYNTKGLHQIKGIAPAKATSGTK